VDGPVKLLVAFVLGLTACAGGASSAGTTVTLSVAGDPAEIDAFRTLIAAFEDTEPGITIKLEPVAGADEQVAKIATGFAAGKPPDLFLMNFRRFGQFAAKDVLEPLGARARVSGRISLDGFYPQALDAFTHQGEQLCLPQNISSQVVYWNEALFEDFGVTPPAPGWDWDTFLHTAKRMTRDTDGDGRIDVYGLGVPPELITLAPFIWQNGGEVVDSLENPSRTVMLDEPAIEAMRFFIELRRVHQVSPTTAEAESEDLESRFSGGRLAMLVESRVITPTLRAVSDLDWDVAPLPRRVQTATMLHSDAYCMAAASEVKHPAFRFVEFALGPEGAPIIARTGRTVPSVRAVAESDAFLDPTQEPDSPEVFLDQIPIIRRTPILGTWTEIEDRANVIVEEWYFGLEPPEALGVEIDIATRELFANPDIS